MSTLSEREAILRRALVAATDGIEPTGDGLQRIQHRLRPPRPVAVAWVEAIWTDIYLRAPGAFLAAYERVISVTRLAWQRFGPTPGAGGSRTARTLSWLRPLAALGVTVSIVAAGAYVALDAQQAMFPSSANSPHTQGGKTGSGGNSNGGSGQTNTQSSSPVGGLLPPSGSSAARNCASSKPAKSPSPGIGTITPTPIDSSGQGGGVSPSSSASDTAEPNPTGTATVPIGGPTTGASTPAAGGTNPVTSRSPKPNGSSSPCAKKTTSRNPVNKAYPNTQVSQPSTQVSPSDTPASSAAALGFARLEIG
jgi:hypothetical protein